MENIENQRSPDKHPPEPASADPAPLRPADLIARLGIDGLNRNADGYYRKIGDFSQIHCKPFAAFHESQKIGSSGNRVGLS